MRAVCCVAQSMLLVNVVYFAFLCHLTLPLYSLVVHMGSDIKREALPAELRARLQRARDHYNQASHANLMIVKCQIRCKDANVCCADRQKPSFLLLRAHVNAFLIVVNFIFAAADLICFGHIRWQDRRRHQAIYSVWWGAGQGGPRSRLEEGTLLSPRRTPPASMRDHDLPCFLD